MQVTTRLAGIRSERSGVSRTKYLLVLAVSGILLSIATQPAADTFMGYEGFTYEAADKSEATIPYRLFVPHNYTPSQLYPLLIYLHGVGQRGTDNRAQVRDFAEIPSLFTGDSLQKTYPCCVLVPQCPKKFKWVDVSWGGSYSLDNVGMSPALKSVVSIINGICDSFSIDIRRIYMSGGSMGGFGAWDIVMRYPDLFAAAMPMCGGGDPSMASAIKDISFWIWHGTKDGIVPIEVSREMYNALTEAGADVQMTEKEYGHFIWEPAAEEPGLADWLFSISKDETGAFRTMPENRSASVIEVGTRNHLRHEQTHYNALGRYTARWRNAGWLIVIGSKGIAVSAGTDRNRFSGER